MSPEVSERSFEEAIECGLLQHGPDACPGDGTSSREASLSNGKIASGGYRKRGPEDYDRTLCLLPRDVVDFVLATQPKEWEKLKQHHGATVSEQFLRRLATEIERRGVLDVLRHGIKDSGCKFKLAYFRKERAQRGDTPSSCSEPVRRGAAGPLQHEKRKIPGSRSIPERHPDLHSRTKKSAQRPGCRRCDPSIQN
jgi:hypothetical protein